MQEAVSIVGVDVAQAELVVSHYQHPHLNKSVSNQAGAIEQWLTTLEPGSIVAMEATGRYHRLLAQLAHAAGMQVYVLNARDVYFYARALGARGKTDRLDAVVIARYAAEHHESLKCWQPGGSAQMAIQELLGRRWMFTRQLVAVKQSMRDLPSLAEAGERLKQEYQRLFDEIDRQLETLVQADAGMNEGVQRLRTIAGFGVQASIGLGALLSRIQFDNADALVAYSGLDPRPCDSGAKKGTRRLSKRGPAQLRRQMYLAAFGAARSKALGPIYIQLKARGFAPTQALVILARKLLRVAWAIWKSGKDFEPGLVGKQGGCKAT